MKNLQRHSFLYLVMVMILSALGISGCRTEPSTVQAADAVFSLKAVLMDGRMSFVGVGGAIDGVVNPELTVRAGDAVRLVIVNDDDMHHDIAIPDLNVHAPLLVGREQAAELTFQAGQPGTFAYYCTVTGHREVGMEGELIVTEREK